MNIDDSLAWRTLIDLRASNTVEAIRPTMGRTFGSISGKLARI